MKLDKMWLDGKPVSNPKRTSRANRNIVANKTLDAIVNEAGNLIVEGYGSAKKYIGSVVLDNNDLILFTKPNPSTSEIGYLNSNKQYITLINDSRLEFDINKPIYGTFQKDVFGDIIIVFNDGEKLRYFNKDKSILINGLNVFADTLHPEIEADVITGGNLKSGAYYPIISYESADKIVTSWFKDYNPLYVTNIGPTPTAMNDFREGSLPNIQTDKAITLTITGLDTRYRKARIGVVFQANNQRVQYYLHSVNITSPTLTTTIFSLDKATSLLISDVVIDKLKFKSVKHLTQLENILYISDLTTYQEANNRNIINNIKLKYKSTLLDFLSMTENFKDSKYNNQIRHLQHGEVYAIYIRAEYHWGFGQWQHIPGRVSKAGDFDNYVDNFVRFQAGDTCGLNGELGYWENLDEPYPSGKGFPLGNVRHIKTPSIKWMKENFYNSDPLYGSRKLDVLTLEVEPFNVSDLKDSDGNSAIDFQIGYAKRSRQTGLVAGQSIFILGADRTATPENIYTSMGFNANYENIGNANRLVLGQDQLRTYDFESLYDKSAPNINYVKSEVILSAPVTFSIFDQQSSENPDYHNNRYGIANFYQYPATTMSGTGLAKVKNTRFVINNTILDKIDNRYLEDTINVELDNTTLPLPAIPIITGDVFGTVIEYTHLITLLNIKRNCYSEFFNQVVIPCNKSSLGYGGDTYISLLNINTLGTTTQPGYSSDPTQSDDNNTPVNGTRIANMYVVESRLNASLRYVNAGAEGNTYHYPHDDANIFLPRLKRDKEPNLIIQGYSLDYNAENDLEATNIYNPNIDLIERDQFQIRRSSPINNTTNINNWLTFRVNDVYNLDRTKGDLVFLGAAKDFLIIHHRNALFRTRVRTYIATTGEEAYTGQGDIFQNPPEELVYDTVGALGTQHRWSCYISKEGYFWINSNVGRFYRYDGRVTELSANGLYNFFQDNSECTDDNPFNSFGYHVVFDEENRRLIVTKKHVALIPAYKKRFRGVWKSDQKFLSSLKPGDIILKDGKHVRIT